jgi:alkylated DNA nucleotide flippase Atl1
VSLNYFTSDRDRIIAGFSAREVLDYVQLGGKLPWARVAKARQAVARSDDDRAAAAAVRRGEVAAYNERWRGAVPEMRGRKARAVA